MSGLLLGTSDVRPDEPCWSLKEVNEQTPDYKGFHRYQIIKVIRHDRVAEYRRDLGPSDQFTVDEFFIPGGVVDPATGRGELIERVGDLIDIAAYLRSDYHTPPPKPEPHDLIRLYHELPERQQIAHVKRSVFSPLVKVQRG